MKSIKDLKGNEYVFNRRRKIDRFLLTLDENKLIYTNNSIRIKIDKGHINVSDYSYDVFYQNGSRCCEFETKGEMIEHLKKELA